MHTLLLSTCCGVAALLADGVASANEELNGAMPKAGRSCGPSRMESHRPARPELRPR